MMMMPLNTDSGLATMDNITNGTINFIVLTKDGIAIGVDSRCTRKVKDKNTVFTMWVNDNSPKCKLIAPGVIITLSGHKGRNDELWNYLDRKEIRDKIRDLDHAAELIKSFLEPSKIDELEGCELFLAGYSHERQEYIVYHTGDGMLPMKEYTCKEDDSSAFAIAIGSGSRHARKSFKRHSHQDMNPSEILECVAKVLLDTCLASPSCGGFLQVYWMTKIEQVTNKHKLITRHITYKNQHMIDTILELKIPSFDRPHLLLFSAFSHNTINYFKLAQHFTNDVKHTLEFLPFCLGYIVPGKWTCFLVDAAKMVDRNNTLADKYFEQYCQPFKNHDPSLFRYAVIRRYINHMNEKVEATVLVMRASYEVLRDARHNNLLDQFNMAV